MTHNYTGFFNNNICQLSLTNKIYNILKINFYSYPILKEI